MTDSDIFQQLQKAAFRAHEENDLPDRLLSRILQITAEQEKYLGKETLLHTLIEQLAGYDPYAGAGCFGASFGIETLNKTLQQLD